MKDGDIIINGNNKIWSTYGVAMGEGFLEALQEPVSFKPLIENESRHEDGKRVIFSNRHTASRELTLEFVIVANTSYELLKRKKEFLELIYGHVIWINVPAIETHSYKLIYTGSGGAFGTNPQGNCCKLLLKFVEPAPKSN